MLGNRYFIETIEIFSQHLPHWNNRSSNKKCILKVNNWISPKKMHLYKVLLLQKQKFPDRQDYETESWSTQDLGIDRHSDWLDIHFWDSVTSVLMTSWDFWKEGCRLTEGHWEPPSNSPLSLSYCQIRQICITDHWFMWRNSSPMRQQSSLTSISDWLDLETLPTIFLSYHISRHYSTSLWPVVVFHHQHDQWMKPSPLMPCTCRNLTNYRLIILF